MKVLAVFAILADAPEAEVEEFKEERGRMVSEFMVDAKEETASTFVGGADIAILVGDEVDNEALEQLAALGIDTGELQGG